MTAIDEDSRVSTFSTRASGAFGVTVTAIITIVRAVTAIIIIVTSAIIVIVRAAHGRRATRRGGRKRKRAAVRALHRELVNRWPTLFDPVAPKPLAISIDRAIRAALSAMPVSPASLCASRSPSPSRPNPRPPAAA